MRVTALLRRMLALELLQRQIPSELRILKQTLQEQNLSILQRTEQPLDIQLEYRWKGRIYQAAFMRPMLDAEVQGLLDSLNPDAQETRT